MEYVHPPCEYILFSLISIVSIHYQKWYVLFITVWAVNFISTFFFTVIMFIIFILATVFANFDLWYAKFLPVFVSLAIETLHWFWHLWFHFKACASFYDDFCFWNCRLKCENPCVGGELFSSFHLVMLNAFSTNQVGIWGNTFRLSVFNLLSLSDYFLFRLLTSKDENAEQNFLCYCWPVGGEFFSFLRIVFSNWFLVSIGSLTLVKLFS